MLESSDELEIDAIFKSYDRRFPRPRVFSAHALSKLTRTVTITESVAIFQFLIILVTVAAN